VAVVETGLGGRLDATNVLPPPALCVISSIGLDHTEHLGGTPGAIALEKAGILKPGSVCLCGDMAPEALAAVRAKGAEAGCPVFGPQTELRPAGVDWRGGWQELEGSEGSLRLNLLGAQAARNAALARDAARLLSDRGIEVPAEAFRSACWSVQWPARFQVVPVAGRVLVVDGAHNPPAMKAFLETWALSPFGGEGAMFLIGMLKDKDYRAMLGMAASHARQAISVRAPSPRALDPASASSLLSGLGSRVHACVDGPREAIERWLESPSPAAAACGSFTLAGAVLRELGLGAS
jgi:dihydrofolate synthase/folylpolyglutamate synthase